MSEKTWFFVGLGVAVVAGVYFYSKKASAAAPPPGIAPYSGPLPTPPLPVPTPTPAPIPSPVTNPITKIEQAEPVMYNPLKKGWSMGLNIYRGVSSSYDVLVYPGVNPPTLDQWNQGLAIHYKVSPNIISVSGD